MAQVLLVTDSGKNSEALKTLLKTFGYSETDIVKSGGDARRHIAQNSYDIVVVNAPLHDETGFEVAVIAAQVTTAGVVLIVKNEVLDEVVHKISGYGVLSVGKPVTRRALYMAVKMADASRARLIKLKKENEKLSEKVNEIKLCEKAKYLLVSVKKIDENEAHHYIEKEAMNNRCSKSVIAKRILDELAD